MGRIKPTSLFIVDVKYDDSSCSNLFIIYCFTFHSRIFHLVTITSKGIKNVHLYLAAKAFEEVEIFTVSHLLGHGDSFFASSHMQRTTQFIRFFRFARGWKTPISTRTLMGPHSLAYEDPG
jgi:hypothetical protein